MPTPRTVLRQKTRRELLLVLIFGLLIFVLSLIFPLGSTLVGLLQTAPYPAVHAFGLASIALLLGTAIFAWRRWREVLHQYGEKEEAERRAQALAYTDQLTGLANRALVLDRLDQALSKAEREETLVALIFLDLDGFKKVNESLGHSAGDKLLQGLTRRLLPYVRKSDTVGRFGGDEFVFIMTSPRSEQDISQFAKRMIELVAEPMLIEGHSVSCTASVGIAVSPWDCRDRETLLRNADTAMYSAKAQGKNQLQFYAAKLNLLAKERMQIESGLRKALDLESFELLYQPQASMETGGIIGAEALVRWRHPVRGLISPGKFIGVAEETGLIVPLGAWVLRTACRQGRWWVDQGHDQLTMAVNVSAKQFIYSDFPKTVADILQQTGFPPHLLELEITENVVVQDIDSTRHTLKRLTDLGVSLAIDDFGTGFSSLKYLRHFDFHRLKIDQSFVRVMHERESDRKIVLAIIALADALGMEVIAEGVENWEQLEFLKSNLCHSFQGYVFSRPLTAAQFSQRLKSGARLDVGFAYDLNDVAAEDLEQDVNFDAPDRR